MPYDVKQAAVQAVIEAWKNTSPFIPWDDEIVEEF